MPFRALYSIFVILGQYTACAGACQAFFCDSWPMNRIFYICAPFCRILSNARPRVIKFGSLTVFHLPAGLDKPHKRGYPSFCPEAAGIVCADMLLTTAVFCVQRGWQPFFHHKIFKRHAMADHGLRAQHAVAAALEKRSARARGVGGDARRRAGGFQFGAQSGRHAAALAVFMYIKAVEVALFRREVGKPTILCPSTATSVRWARKEASQAARSGRPSAQASSWAGV